MESSWVYMIGVFDMFHIGHLNMIQKASTLGNLHVGVIKDEAVRSQKGNDRPIINQFERIQIVNKIKGVEHTTLEDDFYIKHDYIRSYKWIILGEDQTHIKNRDDILCNKLLILPRTINISTSDLVKRLK